MGLVYDPRRGIQHIPYSCGAKIGDYVKSLDGQSYEVVGRDDYGFYVCRNLNESCMASDDVRVFDDLDIEEVYSSIEASIGSGI